MRERERERLEEREGERTKARKMCAREKVNE